MTKTPAAAKALSNCACSEFEIGITTEEDGQPDFDGSNTECSSTTRRVFSPGHDARLKSLLIRAGVEGLEVRHNSGITYGDPVSAARQFGFAEMVAAGIQRSIAKAAAKAEKANAPKAARKPAAKKNKEAAAERAAALTAKMAEVAGKVTIAETPAPVAEPIVEAAPEVTEAPAGTVRIKLGRWEYSATIAANGDANYSDAKGNARVAVEGNYKLA
jgi:hypothetical protein